MSFFWVFHILHIENDRRVQPLVFTGYREIVLGMRLWKKVVNLKNFPSCLAFRTPLIFRQSLIFRYILFLNLFFSSIGNCWRILEINFSYTFTYRSFNHFLIFHNLSSSIKLDKSSKTSLVFVRIYFLKYIRTETRKLILWWVLIYCSHHLTICSCH